MACTTQVMQERGQVERESYVVQPTLPPQKAENLLTSEGLERIIKDSGTRLIEQDRAQRFYMGDCPCPCPPIVTAGIYVTFSPIF